MPLNLIFIQPGNYTIEDDGIPGNNTSVIKDGNGNVIFTFMHPADSLGFTVSTAGVNLTINLTDSLGAADFTIGNLTDPAATPDSVVINRINTTGDVTIVANNAITEGGSDAAADIVAGSLILSAGTGVGTGANAIETQIGTLEAETTTGGINISNFGTVTIGGLTAEVDGLDVITSGDITFTTLGAILLSDDTGPETIHGGSTSGNVTLIANGLNSDIISNIDQDSISAPRGNITLTAGRDIGFGLIGANFDNDVRANGTITFNAGRDFLLDGFADVVSDDFGQGTGGNVVVNAGRNIALLAVAGTDAGITASGSAGADIILNTGPGGTVTLNSGNGTALFASLISNSGNIFVNADRMLIGAQGAISASSGSVNVRPQTPGWEIILGSATDAAFALELSDAELDRIFTPNLTIGTTDTGAVTTVAAISPLNAQNLEIVSGTDIGVGFGITVSGTLSLLAGDNLFHTAGTITANAFSAVVDNAADDGGAGGYGALGTLAVTTTIELSGQADADHLRGAEGFDQTVHGNDGNDRIVSSGEGHYFGDAGNDLMFAGLSSGLPEVLNGGAGIDTLDTTSYTGGYTINLTTGATDFGYESFVNFENLISGDGNDTITGTASDNNIQTGSGNDTIMGLAANDTLDGGLGADTMNGGGGNDTFIVDDPGDVVIEVAGLGTDTVLSSVSFSLAGISIEVLTLTGGAAINGTGNAQAQTINGNGAGNGLYGMNGDDVLNGFGGNDILDGGAGADSMAGGLGDDVFFVDSASDLVIEAAGEGYDTVFTTINYALGSHADRLVTFNPASTAALSLTGNALDNEITGNAGANIIDGGAGADLMVGANGNDIYFVDNVGDVVSDAPGGGFDTVFSSISFVLDTLIERVVAADTSATTALNFTGNASANEITGNNGGNMIDGGGGADLLFGNGGSDAFLFTTALGGGNIDSLPDYQPGVDRFYLDDAVFTGLAPGALPAGAFRIGSAAADADDRIIYNSVTGVLLFDADGNGAGAAVQWAVVHEALAMTASDFQII